MASNRTVYGMPADRLVAALAIALSASFLLCGYEFVRSVSQSLYIKAYSASQLPVVMTLAPVGTLLIIWGYGRLLSLVGARRAIILTSLLSGAVIFGCGEAIRAGSRVATGVLYVTREAYIVLLIEQVWAFINSTLVAFEGRKLNGPICGVASLGAIAGGLLVHGLAVRLGSVNLLVFAALSLVPTGLLAAWAYGVAGEPQPAPDEAGGRHGHLGLRELFHSRLLRNLAVLIMITQAVSALLDLQLSRVVEQVLPATDERTRWFGGFYAGLNGFSALFQFVGAPLLLSAVPLRAMHVGMPLVHIVLCAACLLHPGLWAAAVAYMTFKAFDYSVFRAAKELIYVPLSYDARYRAKELIDAFGYRFAKGAMSGALALAGRFAVLPVAVLPALALAALAGWVRQAFVLTDAGASRHG